MVEMAGLAPASSMVPECRVLRYPVSTIQERPVKAGKKPAVPYIQLFCTVPRMEHSGA